MTSVAASVQTTHIHDSGLGPLSFDLQRRNQRILSVTNNSVRIQAPKSRPRRKADPSPIVATMALAMIGPMPGTVISRWQA
jgi:hypothetical protein